MVDQSKEIKAFIHLDGDSESLSDNVLSSQSLKVELDTWHLIGVSIGFRVGNPIFLTATVFVDHSQARFYAGPVSDPLPFALSAPTVLRVGGAADGFVGDVSALRIMTPGAPYLPESNPSRTSLSYISI